MERQEQKVRNEIQEAMHSIIDMLAKETGNPYASAELHESFQPEINKLTDKAYENISQYLKA